MGQGGLQTHFPVAKSPLFPARVSTSFSMRPFSASFAGVLTSNLSVDPKKSLHVEETGKIPLISSKPSESRLQETATVPARAAGFLMAGPQRLPMDLWNLQTMQHPSCPGISPNPGHQKKKRKKSPSTRNKPAVIRAMGKPGIFRQNTVAKGSGPTGKGQKALLVCIAKSFSFPLHTQA